jgi:hypothetical protein
MKQLFIVLFLVTSSVFICHSQDSLLFARFDYTGNEFSSEMNKHIRRHRNTLSGYVGICFSKNKDFSYAMDTACEIGMALVKFKVKENGIIEVACTKSTHDGLAKIFKEAVERSAPYWKAKGNSDLYYVLPIHYNFRNCNDIQIKKGTMESDYAFNFDDGVNIEEVPCVILRPLKFMSSTGHDYGPPLLKK